MKYITLDKHMILYAKIHMVKNKIYSSNLNIKYTGDLGKFIDPG